MTCQECEEILLDSDNCASRKGWMPGVSVLNLAKLHAENCSACAARVSKISRMHDALDQLRFSAAQMEAPATVEANLLLEFRKRASRSTSGSHAFRWRLVWGPAVAFVLIAALVSYSLRRPRSAVAIQAHGVEPPAQQMPSSRDSGASPDRESIKKPQAGAMPRGLSSSKHESRSIKESPEEPALPAPDELSLNGGSNVVRVTLPLASLVAMGVPMYPGAPDQRITADVARDPFGAVIAIHLVETRPSTN